jgi:hypothetical protein
MAGFADVHAHDGGLSDSYRYPDSYAYGDAHAYAYTHGDSDPDSDA